MEILKSTWWTENNEFRYCRLRRLEDFWIFLQFSLVRKFFAICSPILSQSHYLKNTLDDKPIAREQYIISSGYTWANQCHTSQRNLEPWQYQLVYPIPYILYLTSRNYRFLHFNNDSLQRRHVNIGISCEILCAMFGSFLLSLERFSNLDSSKLGVKALDRGGKLHHNFPSTRHATPQFS